MSKSVHYSSCRKHTHAVAWLLEKWCTAAGVVVCMGTSLHVTPASDLPELCAEDGGHMYIVNLQRTEHDKLVWFTVHSALFL